MQNMTGILGLYSSPTSMLRIAIKAASSLLLLFAASAAAIPNELIGLLSCHLSQSALWLCYAGLGVAAYSIFTLYRYLYLRKLTQKA